MIPVHSIIMWAQPKNLGIEKSTDICYEILNLLKKYGADLSPNFLPAKRKSDSRIFELTKRNVKTLLIKNVNKEDGKIFADLGSCISFFLQKKKRIRVELVFILDQAT